MGELVTVLNAAGGAFVAFAAHMLIQSSVLIILLAALDLVLRRRVKAVVRYWIWLLVLAKLILPPSFSSPTGVAYWVGGQLPALSGPIEPLVGESSTPSLPADGTAVPSEPWGPDSRPSVRYAPEGPPVARPDNTPLYVTPHAPLVTWQLLVLLGWAVVVIVMAVLLARRALFVHRLVAQSRAPGPEIVELLRQCARRMGVRTDLAVKLSPLSASPSVCGLRRPVILIPEGMLSQLPVHELRSVLFHELGHIKRGDLWLNLLQAVLQVVYFYHPLLWAANVRIRRVREQAVDETVLAALGEEAEDYPRTLLSVSRAAFGQPTLSLRLLGVVESEKALKDRIRHMVSQPFPKSAKLGCTGLLLVFAVGAMSLPMARATSDASPAGEPAASAAAPVVPDGSAGPDAGTPTAKAELQSKLETERATCGGTVVDEQGRPIEGVAVVIWWYDAPGHLMRGRCTTDAQGRWQVALSSEARDVDIQLTHPDYISDESYREDKPPLSRLRDGTSVMVMKRGLRLSGRVQNEEGKPIANALVLPHDRYATAVGGAALEDATTARTGADGRFVLTGLPAGPRELTVTAPGYGPEAVAVNVTPETPTLQVTMRPGGVFRGQILDENGLPVEDAGVYCRRWRTEHGHIVSLTGRTDAAGRFAIADTPWKGDLEFYVSKKGFLHHDSRVSLPAEPYRATLYRPPVLSGTVLDDQTGAPVADFEVAQGILWPTSSRLSWLDRQAVHSEGGTFTVTFERFGVSSAPPWCAVRVRAVGYVPEMTPLVLVGEKPTPFTVRLSRGQSWSGFIRDPADRPVANVSVAWIGPDRIAFIKDGQLQPQFVAAPEWVVRTDSQGRFELPPAKTDGIILALHDTGYGWWRSASFTRDSVVRLTAWSRIAGTIRRAGSDNHTMQLNVQLADPAMDVNDLRIRWFFDTTSHVDGQFAFEFVPSLRLAVRHILDDKFFLADHVTPQPGQTCNLTIRAEPPAPALRSLVGRTLPALKDIGLESAAASLQNQRVLLCFFDLQQRPSRYCLQQLTARAQELRAQEIAIVVVAAVAVDRAELDKWVKDNHVPFPVGTIRDDESRIRSAWGVQSLPRLILADEKHTVRAEGFGLDELENTIEAIAKEQRTAVCLVKGAQGKVLAREQITVGSTGTKYQTDADGKFSIRYDPPADLRGLLVLMRHKDPDLIGDVWLPPAGGEVEVALKPAVSVQGRVTNPDGKPIAGAQVGALPMTDQYVLTDAAGAFDVAWASEWGPPDGLCLMSRHTPSGLAALVDLDSQVRTLAIRLEPALTLAGVVEDEDDKPVPGVSVGVSLRKNGWTCGTPVEPVKTDSAGRYTFGALPQNQEYVVYAKAPGYWAVGGTTGVINNRPAVAEAGRIVLKRPVMTVSGLVVDANNAPVVGIRVGSSGVGQPQRTTETDAQGRFTLQELCRGDVEIWAKRDRFLYGTATVEAGRKDAKVVVRPIE